MADKLKRFLKINRKFFLAVIALCVLASIFCSITFSWVEGVRTGRVDDVASTVSASNGIIFTDVNGSLINSLSLSTANLSECSSLDGRNFFFPTGESVSNGSDSNMVFRAGTDADKNTKYISTDFNVISFSASELYIEDESAITCTNLDVKSALRIALNFNDGTAPILLNGLDGYERDNTNFQPVTKISENGLVKESGVTIAEPFSNYYINGKSLHKINAGESKRVTFSIWLEGTDKASASITSIEELSIRLVLTNGTNYKKSVTFYDYSPNQWVASVTGTNTAVKMFAIDKSTVPGENNYSGGKCYPMVQDKNTPNKYYTKLPDSVVDVAFGRFDPHNVAKDYNYWATTQEMGESDTYYGIGRGMSVDSTTQNERKCNYGYWVKGDATDITEIRLDSKSFRVFSTNYFPNIYFNSVYDDALGTLKQVKGVFDPREPLNLNNNYGLATDYVDTFRVYRFFVPSDATIIINGDKKVQSNPIKLSEVANGKTKIGFKFTSPTSFTTYEFT